MTKQWYKYYIGIFSALLTFSPSLVAVHAATTATVPNPWHYQFSVAGTVNETSGMGDSSSPYWWVNSGGALSLQNGSGMTMQGNAPIGSVWQRAYAAANPLDTDGGLHPQNIFRLVTRSQWQNLEQQVKFKINRLQLSASPNRNASNGVLLFNRYLDSNNLYYVGVRVDGAAVIKKKYQGRYYTMAYSSIFSGTVYDRVTSPNRIPVNTWMGMKSVIKNNANGTVMIQLFIDEK